jgi:hypothetical protein
MSLISLTDWSLTPGPLSDPPPSSVALRDIEQYPPEVVAEAILAFDGMRLKRPAEPTWWDWLARWDQGERWIEVGFTLFDIEPPAWGGSGLEGQCELADMLGLLAVVRQRVPACWMHNTLCEIHSPESFARVARAEPGATPDRSRHCGPSEKNVTQAAPAEELSRYPAEGKRYEPR